MEIDSFGADEMKLVACRGRRRFPILYGDRVNLSRTTDVPNLNFVQTLLETVIPSNYLPEAPRSSGNSNMIQILVPEDNNIFITSDKVQ